MILPFPVHGTETAGVTGAREMVAHVKVAGEHPGRNSDQFKDRTMQYSNGPLGKKAQCGSRGVA